MHRVVPVALTLASSSGGLAYFDPVGRLVAGAAEPVLLDEGLQQMNGMAVASLPVLINPPGNLCKEMTGQERNDHGGQDEEATVVGDKGQALRPLRGGPTDPPIARRALPSRRAKEQAGQIDAVPAADQVAQVLAHRPAMAQVMILAQIPLEPPVVQISGANHLNAQRSQRR